MQSRVRRGARLLLATMCVVVGAPTIAGAQPKQKRAARANMKAGLRHLAKGDYDEAIEKLKISLALGGDAVVHYHIGRAYEAKDDLAQAIYYYETFVEKAPKHPRRADAEERLARLRAKLEAEREPPPDETPDEPPDETPDEAPDEPPVAETPDPEPPPVVASPFESPPREEPRDDRSMTGARIAGLATLGAGVALLGTGTYFAFVARDKSDRISDIFADGLPWEPRYDDLYDDGENAERNARIILGLGGAAAVTGTLLVILGRNRAESHTMSVAPVRGGGAAMSLSCEF